MKKAIGIVGALAVTFLSLGVLFKMLHWPGSEIYLIISLMGLVPATSILWAIYFNLKRKD